MMRNGARAKASNDPGSGQTESRVVRLNNNFRVAKLLGLQGFTDHATNPTTGETTREIDSNFLYYSIASFLASKHFNERKSSILPQLPDLLKGCDFYWGYEYRDGQQQGFEATRQFLDVMDSAYYHHSGHQGKDETRAPNKPETRPPSNDRMPRGSDHNEDLNLFSRRQLDHDREWNDNTEDTIRLATKHLEPFAVYGSYWSQVSKVVGAVTSAFEVPYISGVSHSKELEGMPLFARTSPNNDGDAQSAMSWYHELGISHVAILYVRDTWGVNYHASLRKFATDFDINVASFAYDANSDSIEESIAFLQASEYRYVYAVLHDGREVLPIAYRMGVINPDYMWILAGGKAKGLGGGNQLDRHEDTDLAMALHGVGALTVSAHESPSFDEAMAEFASNLELQEEFVGIQANPELFDNFTFPDYVPSPRTPFLSTAFDAVMALGIAACDPSHNLPGLFTGPEFFEALMHTEFDGVSGHVQFDPKTGSRLAKHVRYSLEYLVIDEDNSSDDYIMFDSKVAATMQESQVSHLQPFLYNDNTTSPYGTTTKPPLALPPVEDFDFNTVPAAALTFGLVSALLIVLSSTVCFVWTLCNRKLFAVRASQPFFLCQLSIGIFLMGLTVIPWSFALSSRIPTEIMDGHQEYHGHYYQSEELSTKGLDVACMSSLWLMFVGYAITFSSLASKTWRLNQLLSNGAAMRRSKVGVREAIVPLYTSMTVNVTILLCITFLSPLQYERVHIDNFDHFGRSIESYAICRPSNDKIHIFIPILLVANIGGLMYVLREAYKGRHAPTLFSDAQYLIWSLMAIMETVIIGGPIFFVVDQDPTALFVATSGLLFLCCQAIIVLMFLPKFLARNQKSGMQTMVSGLKQGAQANNHLMDENGSGTSSTGSIGSTERGRMILTRHKTQCN